MEKIVLVKNDNFKEVNDLLSKGWSVKMLAMTSENVAMTGNMNANYTNTKQGDVYTTVVLKKEC